MRVQGKSIIVTGAGGGIGEGIARRLAAEGAAVIVNDINAELGEKVTAAINAAGGKARFVAGDVTRGDDWAKLVKAAQDFGGRLDVVVNNAGWTHRNRPMLEVSEAEFGRCWQRWPECPRGPCRPDSTSSDAECRSWRTRWTAFAPIWWCSLASCASSRRCSSDASTP